MSSATHTSIWREFVEARVPGYLRPTDAAWLCRQYGTRPPVEWSFSIDGRVPQCEVINHIVDNAE